MALNNQNFSYRCDGTSALAPEYPALTLIQGGKSTSDAPVRTVEANRSAFSLKGLAVMVLVVFMACALCIVRDRCISASAYGALYGAQTTVVTVHDGDSLWSLAQNSSVTGVSTKDIVKWIENENGLDSANIQPGQELIVPSSHR